MSINLKRFEIGEVVHHFAGFDVMLLGVTYYPNPFYHGVRIDNEKIVTEMQESHLEHAR